MDVLSPPLLEEENTSSPSPFLSLEDNLMVAPLHKLQLPEFWGCLSRNAALEFFGQLLLDLAATSQAAPFFVWTHFDQMHGFPFCFLGNLKLSNLMLLDGTG